MKRSSTAAKDAEFAEYMAARQPSLLRTAYLLTGDRHAAEDLVQNALAKLYLSWDKVQRRDLLDGYVRRIMVNENNSLWRRAWKRNEVSTDDGRVLRAADPGNSALLVRDMVWEDDSHALTTVYEDGASNGGHILRLDLDGNIEAASSAVTADEVNSRSSSGSPRPRNQRGHYLSSRDRRRSASGLPPVWQVGQYCSAESAKETSRTVSPQTGHGLPARPCTRRPDFFSFFSSAAAKPSERSIASRSVAPIASYSSTLYVLSRHRSRLVRRHPGDMEDLVGVGVADARDHRLVAKHPFTWERPAAAKMNARSRLAPIASYSRCTPPRRPAHRR